MQTLDDLQRLTASQGMLLYRLVDLGYLTRAQIDELINRLAIDRFAKAMNYLDRIGISIFSEDPPLPPPYEGGARGGNLTIDSEDGIF